MSKEEIIEFLKDNLTIKITKTRDWDCDITVVKLLLNDKTISKSVLRTSKKTGLPY